MKRTRLLISSALLVTGLALAATGFRPLPRYSSAASAVMLPPRGTEGAEDTARRGQDDTAPISADPRPQFRATSVPALTVPATQFTGTKGTSTAIAEANSGPTWISIGPSPIPNGQTDPANANGISTTQSPVSGRTTAIAIDPTDPNIAYVGTAQGGLYRTTNGGASWTSLLDNALALAIGSVKIDPKDRTRVIVGTGEGNFSGDSYVGAGVYMITGANGSSPTLNGPFNLDTAGKDVMTNRCAVAIAIDNQNDNNVFVGTVTGVQGLFGVIPGAVPRRGLFRSTNFMSGSPTFEKIPVLGEDTTTAASDYRVTAAVVDPSNANNLVLAIATSDGAAPQGFYRSANALSPKPTFTKVLDTSDSDIAPARMAVQRDPNTGVVTIVAATGQHNGDTPATSFNQGKVWKTIDGGAHWIELIGARGFAGGQGFYNLGIDIDPVNPNNIYVVGTLSAHTQAGQVDVGDNGTFMYTRDGGVTWKSSVRTLHVDSHCVAVAPSNPAVIYTGNDGGIWKSADAALNWLDANTAGFLATQFSGLALHPIDKNFTLGGTQDNGTELRLPDGTWKRADFGDGGFSLIDQSAGDTESVTMYHTYYNAATVLEGYSRVFKTSCATEGQWAFRGAAVGLLLPGLPLPLPAVGSIVCDGSAGQTLNGQSPADDVNFYAPMALGPSSATFNGTNSVYYGSDKLYESLDQGDHMIAQSQVLEPTGVPSIPDGRPPGVPASPGTNTPISAIGVAATTDNVRLVGTNSGRVWTTNTGGPLVNVTDPAMPVQPVARAVIDPSNANGDVAYVTYVGSGFGGKNHVWKTIDLTAASPTWTPIGTGLPDVSVNAFAVNPTNSNDLYAGTDRGVYNSSDGGKTWVLYGNGLPNVAVFDLAIQKKFGVLRAATHGKGMYEIALASARLRNLSTRALVQTADRVAIGGFIITGSGPKRVMIRAIGPSLSSQGVTGALADPTLELHDETGALIVSNDNWKDTQQAEIQQTGIAPANDLESAIVRTLNPGKYTAIMAGNNGGTGVGLVEIYDLDSSIEPKLANISTRGFVQTGDNVLIGGLIVGGGPGASTRVLIRGIGPSLTTVNSPLQDPTLELHDANGGLITSNDNWKDTQQNDIAATGIAPTNDAEAAILASVVPGNYTAIERGKNDSSGTALVEIYDLGP
ncbi:MAG: WD40/YVTN/BNR-like repeat-containing protein [Chthoniobacterales bacterium]